MAGLAFGVRLLAPTSDAVVVLLGAALYLCSAVASLRLAPGSWDPTPGELQPHLRGALVLTTVRGLVEGCAI